jgi:hypothetical protein
MKNTIEVTVRFSRAWLFAWRIATFVEDCGWHAAKWLAKHPRIVTRAK